jgi:hypothetical protein
VLNLRLTKPEDAAGRARSTRRSKTRRRRGGARAGIGKKAEQQPIVTSDDSDSDLVASKAGDDGDDEQPQQQSDIVQAPVEDAGSVSAMEREIRELEDEQVRQTNAYIGATNTIGSVHQRRWYLSLDRTACGFLKKYEKGKGLWKNPSSGQGGDDEHEGDSRGRLRYPFYVLGPETERSVVTGRLGRDILKDEGVEGYVSRRYWQPVTH